MPEKKPNSYVLRSELEAEIRKIDSTITFKAYPIKGKVTERSTRAARIGHKAILLLIPAKAHVVVKIPASGKHAKRIAVDSVSKFRELNSKIRDILAAIKAKANKKPAPAKKPSKTEEKPKIVPRADVEVKTIEAIEATIPVSLPPSEVKPVEEKKD
jgi:hypothetical protein